MVVVAARPCKSSSSDARHSVAWVTGLARLLPLLLRPRAARAHDRPRMADGDLGAVVAASFPAKITQEGTAHNSDDSDGNGRAARCGLDDARLAPRQLRGVDAEVGAKLDDEVLAIPAGAEVCACDVVGMPAPELAHPLPNLLMGAPRGAQALALDFEAVVAGRVAANLNAFGLEFVARRVLSGADADGPMHHLHGPDLAVLRDLLENDLHRALIETNGGAGRLGA
mmetsp:Transcript_61688/g.178937  ORF Transcript_61688/g.178937 Transcript_61688/m.178937 type:complete len:226 (+) Transcript_61688:233-910(+)